LLKVKLNTIRSFVAEAQEIVATVAASLLSIVPVAEAVPEAMLKFRHFITYPQLLVPIPFQ
jgi:hypothetical protein